MEKIKNMINKRKEQRFNSLPRINQIIETLRQSESLDTELLKEIIDRAKDKKVILVGEPENENPK